VREVIEGMYQSDVPTKDCTKIKRHIISEMFVVKDDGTVTVNVFIHYHDDLASIWAKLTKLEGKACQLRLAPCFVRYLQDVCPYTKTKVWRYRMFWDLHRFKKAPEKTVVDSDGMVSVEEDRIIDVATQENDHIQNTIVVIPEMYQKLMTDANTKRTELQRSIEILNLARKIPESEEILIKCVQDLDQSIMRLTNTYENTNVDNATYVKSFLCESERIAAIF
jgi:hypothetical protein